MWQWGTAILKDNIKNTEKKNTIFSTEITNEKIRWKFIELNVPRFTTTESLCKFLKNMHLPESCTLPEVRDVCSNMSEIYLHLN